MASSADGMKVVAVSPGSIYTRVIGVLTADSSSMLDLTYIGGDVFFVSGLEGTVGGP